MALALAQCFCIRISSVFRPRRIKNEQKGSITAPVMSFRPNIRTSLQNSAEPTTKPAITSPWPLRYFVAECTTTSAPSRRGFCRAGEAKVLSQTTLMSLL